jgi:periplasmic protein TonB
VELDGSIVPPVKLFAPQPRYTEPARRVRLEGPVILRAVIQKDGSVTDVRVLRSMPLGLAESAVETVSTWRYQPATRGGPAVAVYLNLRVDFHLN